MNKHEAEFIHFLSLLPDDGVMLDIGANIGVMTVALAQKAVNGKVYAFEPMPQNLTTLKRIIKYYKLRNVTILETALGNEPGELTMTMPVVDNVIMQGLSHVVKDGITDDGEVFTVPVKTLDTIPELQGAKVINGIKIDVENFELEVFTGAKELLRKHKPIIYCDTWDNPKRLITLDFMKNEIGYSVKMFNGEMLVPYTNQDGINFFLVP